VTDWWAQVANRDIKAILLDSAAALLRADLHNSNDPMGAALAARGELLGRQAAALKMLAEANRIPVVVTNQVLYAVQQETGSWEHTIS